MRSDGRRDRHRSRIRAIGILIGVAACSVPHDMRTADSAAVSVSQRSPVVPSEDAGYECTARRPPVRWIEPMREPDRRQLAEWCAAVGPPEWRPSPARSLAPAAEELEVATWNVHVGGGDLPAFLADVFGYACNAPRSVLSGGHFVLLVQEAFRASDVVPEVPDGARVAGRIAKEPPAGPRVDIVHTAERCGLSLLYVPSMSNGRTAGELGRADRGNAILSTLPLRDPVAIELPLEAQRRVAVVATVMGPGGAPLRLANTHLDVAGSLLRVLGTGGSMRVRQAEGLTEALDLLDPGRSVPTIVAGDMNTWSARESVILRMRLYFPDSPDPGEVNTRGSWPADHIFFRADDGSFELVGDSYSVLERSYGSDHQPRVVTLRRR